MKTLEDIKPFAALLEAEQVEQAKAKGYHRLLEATPNYFEVAIKMGRKYANVDIGPGDHRSGRYMVELETGNIYGIKGYGVIHRGHQYGTLDTINDWSWGDYTAVRKVEVAAKPIFETVQELRIPFDSHETDLYIPCTPQTEMLVENWEHAPNASRFVSQIDGKVWFDLPFAYLPAWERKGL